ncbi:MAG: hypothetical protein ACT4QC_20060 [Planctomycetaceae bacterium]
MARTIGWKFLLAALLLGAGAGCGGADGPQRASVEGTVTFNGEPVLEGTITFTPAEGTAGPTAGGTVDNGQFKIPADLGPVVGKQSVAITGQRKTGKVYDLFPPAKIMWEERKQVIPPNYNSKTELVLEVKSGTNKYELELKGKE